MKKLRVLRFFLKNPRLIIPLWGSKGWLRWVPDRIYLRLLYRLQIGKPLNIDRPTTFNEKLQWLKLHDKNPAYSRCVDKYEVREIIGGTIGEQYLVPLIGLYENVDAIDWQALPDRFALKCTHGSGFNIICTDRNHLDIAAARKKLQRWMKTNMYWYGREWPYDAVAPRLVCERFVSEGEKTPDDYKVLCFNGVARLIEVHIDRYGKHKQDFYDRNWVKTGISQGGSISDIVRERPARFAEMIELSERLASGMRHVRIDWFIVDGKLYFGEMTFYDGSGFIPFDNENDDRLLGSWIDLEERQDVIHQPAVVAPAAARSPCRSPCITEPCSQEKP